MESLKKFSEDIAVTKIKKERLQKIMGQVNLECQNVEDQSRMMTDLFIKYSFESKEKLSKSVQESEIQRSESKKSVEEGLKKLDEKEKFLKRVLQEIHENKEQVERKANELDSVEKSLRIRAEEIDSREENLDAREHEADEKEQTLQSKVYVLTRREKEGRESIQSRRRLLERRENEMDSELERIEREKIELLKKEVEFVNRVEKNEFIQRLSDLKLKLDSRKKSLVQYIQESGSKSSAKPAEVVKDRRKRCFNSTISDADQWMNKDGSGSKQAKIVLYGEAPNEQLTLHPEKSGKLFNPLAQIQNELEAREFEVVAKPAQEICIEGKRRGSGDGFAGEVFIMDSQRQDGKRRCLREGLTEHIKAPPPPPPQNSGSYVTSEAKASPNVAIVEESESLLDNCQLIEKLKVGDVWCCFDLEDSLPRSQVQITRIITNWDGKVMLRVKWLKPCPVYGGEKEWIDAHLPATCGNFIPSRSSTESPKILSHLASANGNGPWTIIPRIGETWAIYKDWDISTWSSNPKIHGNCKYEIVEILSYLWDGSSLCFRVGYLNEIPRSQCHSFLIERSNMYRFSHRVPSTKNHCIDVNGILHFTFELDKRSLPKGLL